MTTKKLINLFGDPTKNPEAFKKEFMVMWDIPSDINVKIPALPNVLYCNKHMIAPLENVFRKLIIQNLHTEIKTFDGCFNIRKQRGSLAPSKHSWGIAIDFNAHLNPFIKIDVSQRSAMRAKYVNWSEQFLDVWRVDFDCGADWNTILDGMHFELKNI